MRVKLYLETEEKNSSCLWFAQGRVPSAGETGVRGKWEEEQQRRRLYMPRVQSFLLNSGGYSLRKPGSQDYHCWIASLKV